MYKKIDLNDQEIAQAINLELQRQSDHIELIASENYVSEDVLKAVGSVLTNKYGEGYPGRRYYGSCEYVDMVESLAIERAKKLFNVAYVNVQSYSGSVANASALATLVPQGGRILGLALSSGGHLTHGFHISFSGVFYEPYTYTVDKNGFLDYEEILRVAQEVKPAVIIAGYSAYSRIVDFKKFREIADQVGAKLFADISHISGFVITGLHPSPITYAHLTMTTTHKTLRGARGAILMTNDSETAKKMNRWVFPGYQGGPLFHTIAGKAVAFQEALQPFYHEYIKQVKKNADAFAKAFVKKGVEIVTGGTDTHLFTINVKKTYKITGKIAEKVLEKVNITTNKNTIPFDTERPLITSGLRLGAPAMTSRKLKEKDFEKIADFIDRALRNYEDETYLADLQKEVLAFLKDFPIVKNFYTGV